MYRQSEYEEVMNRITENRILLDTEKGRMDTLCNE